MAEAPPHIVELARRRAEARAEKRFAAADALRDEIDAAGWSVTDTAEGFHLEPAADAPPDADPAGPVEAAEVATVLHEPATVDVSVHWVVEGWAEDVERAIDAFRTYAAGRSVQYVVVDITQTDRSRWPTDVELVSLHPGTGWGAARNAGLRRSRGRTVVAMDGSVEPTGDVLGPLEAALKDDAIGVCGPFGIVTRDLRQFDEAPGPGPCDAIEGYLMAFRREMLDLAGLFDERFRWYRTADIDWSFRVKDAGFRCEVIPVPVTKHAHRMWFETDPAERARWSKRNFYRFLNRFRDRWDLVLSGKPKHEHDQDHQHEHDGDGPASLPDGR